MGIDYFAVNKRHFRTKSRKRLALEADMLGNMEFFHQGRGDFMCVSRCHDSFTASTASSTRRLTSSSAPWTVAPAAIAWPPPPRR